MSKECKEPPWVFATQVIQEDEEEVPHAPDPHEVHDAHDVYGHEHEEQELTSFSHLACMIRSSKSVLLAYDTCQWISADGHVHNISANHLINLGLAN